MNILSIEASGMVASVAVSNETTIIGEYTINNKKTHSQTLLPMVDELLKRLEMDIEQMDAFAISKGPGSFTGLRIGSATVKGFAMALDKPVVEVSTLEGMANNLAGSDRVICPMIDARNKQVFTAAYTYQDNQLCIIIEESANSVNEMCDKLNEIGKPVLLLGDGVDANSEIIKEALTVDYRVAPANLSRQKASSIAQIAHRLYAEGKAIDSDKHSPSYLRPSQAERLKK